MDIRRFFSEAKPKNSIIELLDEEAYHLRKVLRVKIGTEIEITDGNGTLYYGTVESFSKQGVDVKIVKNISFPKNDKRIIIAPSLLKRAPMNFMIEKLTEIGIDEITPVMFNRTELKSSDRIVDKWKKIAIASIKVNKRVWLSKINSPIAFEDIIKRYDFIENKYMLDIQGKNKISNSIERQLIAIIGPPGDYINKERELLIENGYKSVKISSSILKVETAAISVSAVFMEKELSL